MGFEYFQSKVVSEFKAVYYFIYYFKASKVFIIILEVCGGKVVCQDND